jgi:hypothetical protein
MAKKQTKTTPIINIDDKRAANAEELLNIVRQKKQTVQQPQSTIPLDTRNVIKTRH